MSNSKFFVDGFTLEDGVLTVLYYQEQDTESKEMIVPEKYFTNFCNDEYGFTIAKDWTGENVIDVDFDTWWDNHDNQTEAVEEFINKHLTRRDYISGLDRMFLEMC